MCQQTSASRTSLSSASTAEPQIKEYRWFRSRHKFRHPILHRPGVPDPQCSLQHQWPRTDSARAWQRTRRWDQAMVAMARCHACASRFATPTYIHYFIRRRLTDSLSWLRPASMQSSRSAQCRRGVDNSSWRRLGQWRNMHEQQWEHDRFTPIFSWSSPFVTAVCGIKGVSLEIATSFSAR